MRRRVSGPSDDVLDGFRGGAGGSCLPVDGTRVASSAVGSWAGAVMPLFTGAASCAATTDEVDTLVLMNGAFLSGGATAGPGSGIGADMGVAGGVEPNRSAKSTLAVAQSVTGSTSKGLRGAWLIGSANGLVNGSKGDVALSACAALAGKTCTSCASSSSSISKGLVDGFRDSSGCTCTGSVVATDAGR